jgi:hypothetical protein
LVSQPSCFETLPAIIGIICYQRGRAPRSRGIPGCIGSARTRKKACLLLQPGVPKTEHHSEDAFLDPTGRDGYKLVLFLKSKGKFRMKRIAVFTLLAALSVGWSIPAKAQRMSVAEAARQSRKADKKQQKMNRKAAKKQQKATKKYEKAQRKAAKKANHRAKRTS